MEAFKNAIQAGHQSILCHGNIFDLILDESGADVFFTPQYIAEYLFKEGMVALRYSRSTGLQVYRDDESAARYPSLRRFLEEFRLNTFLAQTDISPVEVIQLFRTFKVIANRKHAFPVAIVVDYTHHLSVGHGPSIEERIVTETLNDISTQPAVRRHGNRLIMISTDLTGLPAIIKGATHHVEFSFPAAPQYQAFLEVLAGRPDEFAAMNFDAEAGARLSVGLKLTDIANLSRACKGSGRMLEEQDILQKKQALIEQISDDTLKILPTQTGFDDMAGLSSVKRVLRSFAAQLRNGDTSSPRALLLAGPPGTGKTTIASAIAREAGFNLVQLSDSIKSKWVGESEARLANALSLIEALTPVCLFIDEIDNAFPKRSAASLDGGVSQHYLKSIFQFAAREDLRGKILIIAASNTPQHLDPALINRFITIPMLEATPEDMARIFPITEKWLLGTQSLKADDPNLLEASHVLYEKGATPRQISEILNHARLTHGILTGANVLNSARDFRCGNDRNSFAYSSLSAIQMTSFSGFLPWADAPADYPYPWYLNDLVNPETGIIDEAMLRRRINEFSNNSQF
ncbi:MAG: ATP-binding protein [Bacteroidota bacterium]|jgi:hypothetical protein